MNIGGVLYYYTRGHNRPCGQAVGANGLGGYAVILLGTAEQANDKAREILKALEKDGHSIKTAEFVPNDVTASWGGSPVCVIECV